MELSLRLDTLGMVELRYLRGRERYRDWPPFLFVAASRQARVLAYMNRDVVDQLHHQILAVEEAAGLGSDDDDDDGDISFTTTSGPPFPGITRSFTSFIEAAQENADSRVYAGIHFRTTCTDGVKLGRKVGRFAFQHYLKPAKKHRD